MKKRNLIHFVESILLIPLFFLFAFFMRMRGDLFFTFTLIFTAIAAAAQIIYLYIVGDSDQPHPCKILPIDISDLLFLYGILQIGLAMIFLVLHNLGDFSPWTALAVYLLLLIVTALLLLVPAPADPPPPAPENELDDVSEKKLRYYASYLIRLCRKCQHPPLAEAMTEIADLLPRIDTAYSVQLQTLEDDLSSKCVKVENALLTGEHAKLPLLTRELEATLAYMQKRIGDYRYILTDEGFCHEDDEIAMGQIDHLLDKLGLEYEEDLETVSAPFTDEFFYKKAMLFASEDYKKLLEDYNTRIQKRIADAEAAKLARRDHALRHLRRGSHVLSGLLILCAVALPLLWHFAIQPAGLLTSADEEGNLTVIGYNPFYGDELTIPATLGGKKVIAVGRDALKGGDLVSLTLEEGVERLEYQSIRDNKMLQTLTLPGSLKEIGNYACYNLSALRTVYYAGSAEDWEKIEIGVNGNAPLEKATIDCAEPSATNTAESEGE